MDDRGLEYVNQLSTEIDKLRQQIELRDKVIDEQRLRIKLLQIELNNKKWWRIWK